MRTTKNILLQCHYHFQRFVKNEGQVIESWPSNHCICSGEDIVTDVSTSVSCVSYFAFKKK
jgi:hypothetical protein